MKNFKTGGREREKERSFGGRGGFNKRNSFGGSNRGGSAFGGRPERRERPESAGEMFSATCTTCGKSCEVPFKPTGDRPVFCRDCFGKLNDSRNDARSEAPRREFTRDSRPTAPTYAAPRPDNSLNDIKRLMTALDSKLNRILDLINPPMPAKKAYVPETPVVSAEVAEVTKEPKVRKPKAVAKKAAPKKVTKKTK